VRQSEQGRVVKEIRQVKMAISILKFLFYQSIVSSCAIGIMKLGVLRLKHARDSPTDFLDVDGSVGEEIRRQEVSMASAIMFPLLSSAVLLALFYFGFAADLMLLLLFFSCFSSVAFAVFPLARKALARADKEFTVARVGTFRLSDIAAVCLSILLLVIWSTTGSDNASNAIGVCIVVSGIAFVRLPNLKVATLLLILLFAYDIFWVFFSESIFGGNVMVKAAKSSGTNPVRVAAQAVSGNTTLTQSVPKQLALPIKLIFHFAEGPSMLGLGDIFLPGTLIAFASRVDDLQVTRGKRRHQWMSLEASTFIGYAVGMAITLLVLVVTRHAQPALLYLVPGILVPLAIRARQFGELSMIWRGPKFDRMDEDEQRAVDDVEGADEEMRQSDKQGGSPKWTGAAGVTNNV